MGLLERSKFRRDRLCRVKTPSGWEALILRDLGENLTTKPLAFMRYWKQQHITDYCRERGWQFTQIAFIDAAEEHAELQRLGVIKQNGGTHGRGKRSG